MKQYQYHYDIAVIGGGTAGLAPTITADPSGKKVQVEEKHAYLGGNTAIGLTLLGFMGGHRNK